MSEEALARAGLQVEALVLARTGIDSNHLPTPGPLVPCEPEAWRLPQLVHYLRTRLMRGWVSGCNKRRNRALRDCVTGQLGANRYDRMRGGKAR